MFKNNKYKQTAHSQKKNKTNIHNKYVIILKDFFRKTKIKK